MQKEQISDWTPASYHFFRVCLGFYFFTLWSRLLPWGPELFSCEGLFSTPALSPFWGYFPSLFFYFDSPSSVLVLQGLAILASLSLIFNKASRSCAFYLWLFLASAYNKNPLISNPSLAYLGWVLLAHSFSPTHPLPLILRKSLWWLLVTGYSISGWYKLESPSWIDGSALIDVLQSPLSRDYFWVDFLLNHPLLLKALTWSSLILECLAFPLSLFRPLQRWLWIALSALQLGILTCIDFIPITLGMFLVHALAADLDWIAKPTCKQAPILFIDSKCLICNAFSRWLFQEDRSHLWRVAPLGGITHRSLDPQVHMEALIVWDIQLYRGWQALAYLFSSLGGWWYLLGKGMKIVPSFIAKPLYRTLARFRYFIPASKSCSLPPPSWQKRTLE